MDISSIKPIQTGRSSHAGRYVLGAVLLVALAVVVFAGFAQDAQAQGEINDIGILATNFVSNGSFEKGSAIPKNWFEGDDTLTSKDKRVCNQSYAGSCSFKMVGDTTQKWLVQCKDYSGTDAGNKFKLKAWAKGKALNLGVGEAKIYVDFYDGENFVNSKNVSVGVGTFGWTSRQFSATAQADYTTICIFLQLVAEGGTVWFDKVSLVYVGGP
jgi:hypothetical protein